MKKFETASKNKQNNLEKDKRDYNVQLRMYAMYIREGKLCASEVADPPRQ